VVQGSVRVLERSGKKREWGGRKRGATRSGITVLYRSMGVGDGRRGGAMWQVRAERGGDSRPTDGRCSVGSSPRSVGVSGVARPCRAAGSRGEREGLTGGPGHIVLGGCAG
jgi:hypothetical protein